MFRFLPWKTESARPFLRALLVVGLSEAARSGFFAGLLPFYGPEKLNTSLPALMFAFTLNHLFDNLFKPLGGLLAQKYGVGRIVLLASLGALITLLTTYVLANVWVLWLTSAIWGVLTSPLYPGLSTLASRIAIPGKESRALSLTAVLLMPWYGLGIVGTGQLASRQPELGLFVTLLLSTTALLLAFSLGSLCIPAEKSLSRTHRSSWLNILAFMPSAFGQTFAPGLVSLLFLRYAKDYLSVEPILVGLIGLLGGGLALALLPLATRWVDQKGFAQPLVVGPALIGIAILGLVALPKPFLLVPLSLTAGAGFGLLMAGWNGYLAKKLPQHNRAAFWGAIMTVEGIGVATGPTVGSYLWETLGPQSPFQLGGLVFLGVSLYHIFLFLRGER